MDLSILLFLGLTFIFTGSVLPLGGIRKAGLAFMICGLALLLAVSLSVLLFGGGGVGLNLWLSPRLGFNLSQDMLSAVFTALISVVGVSACIYSLGYIEHLKGVWSRNILTALMGLFILSMVLVVNAKDMYTFLFFWETMSLTSFFLVLHDFGNPENRRAAIFYFIMTQLSAALLFIGFIILYHFGGSLALEPSKDMPPDMLGIAVVSLFLGFSMKAGLIPFHKWLPYAHPASPSNISALMSAVMLKVAVYGLVRYILFESAAMGLGWGVLIMAAGTTSAIFGVLYALKEHDIKRLLAYHSIENIGIIYLGLGTYLVFQSENMSDLAMLGLIGALLHTVNHALFKGLLFMTAGSVVNATGTRNIELLGGLIKRMPYTASLFLIGAASISALPPLNGFVSELMIFQALMQSYTVSGQLLQVFMILCLSIFALTSAFAAACFVKAFGIIFLAVPRSEKAEKAVEVGGAMLWGPALLAASCIFLGLFSSRILSFAGYNPNIPDMLAVAALLSLTAVLTWAFVKLTSVGPSRVSETWGCGISSQNCRMEYTAAGFSEPIMRIFKSVYRTREEGERNFFDVYGSVFKEGTASISQAKFFEQRIYLPISRAVNSLAEKVSRLQNGHLDTYLSYVFITVIALFIAIGWLI